ncbi:TIGR00266 family protein [Brevibacillus laterosporus]|uniref:TIGR00266 family protein n=1 Tax=Brevibacillus laterosporus TaxID=1465 RepID=UPI000839C9D2|nr:TIGR00266 family protein [Brevibacillus laterosporus]
MEYHIMGSTMQALQFNLQPGERLFTESGSMIWMSENIKMDTSFKGGMLKSLGRAFSGESLTFTFFEALHTPGMIAFAPVAPGKIIPVTIHPGNEIIAQKHAFLVGTENIDVSIHFQKKLGTGFFGGEGFIMQRLSGRGMVFLEIDGEVAEMNLQHGEVIKVDTAHVAAYESSVDMSIERVKGIKNIIFGGEGLFLTTLRGPGKIWLQTMTIAGLAGKIAANMGKSGNGGMINGIGDLFKD